MIILTIELAMKISIQQMHKINHNPRNDPCNSIRSNLHPESLVGPLLQLTLHPNFPLPRPNLHIPRFKPTRSTSPFPHPRRLLSIHRPLRQRHRTHTRTWTFTPCPPLLSPPRGNNRGWCCGLWGQVEGVGVGGVGRD